VQGAELTVVLAALSQLIGVILGLFAALGRLSRMGLPFFRWIAGVYIWLFRGTPLLIQIIFVYFAVPQLTGNRIIISEFPSALIALSLNEGAYMAEIIRAGITSVEAGQMEAAESLGMTRWLAMRRVILPQAIRFIIPPTGNEFISMLKNTSLAYAVGAHELLFETQQIISATFNYFELLAVAALWYLAMTTVATYLQSHVERYFERGFTREIRQPGIFQRVAVGALRRG
jgi:polar amino acid transport system permease protein